MSHCTSTSINSFCSNPALKRLELYTKKTGSFFHFRTQIAREDNLALPQLHSRPWLLQQFTPAGAPLCATAVTHVNCLLSRDPQTSHEVRWPGDRAAEIACWQMRVSGSISSIQASQAHLLKGFELCKTSVPPVHQPLQKLTSSVLQNGVSET